MEKEEGDIAVLIYQDCLRRKAEAAAIAAAVDNDVSKKVNAAPKTKRASQQTLLVTWIRNMLLKNKRKRGNK